MTGTEWPKGFKRGLPDCEGCYACIFSAWGYCVDLVDVFEREDMGGRLVIKDYDRDRCIPIEESDIVGYLWLCESSDLNQNMKLPPMQQDKNE